MKDDDFIQQNVESLHFFTPLQTKDKDARRTFLDALESSLKEWSENGVHPQASDAQGGFTLHTVLPVVLRLSYDCPFFDVREQCARMLQELEEGGVRIPRKRFTGPSSFICPHEVVAMDTDDEETHVLLVESFLVSGRVTNYKRVMSYHATYLNCYTEAEAFLMQGEGPLPLDWRYYIGIMASARNQCMYLVDLCQSNFILHNGDADWLKGIEHAPKKLQNLLTTNKLLAHRPWCLTEETIKVLLRCSDPAESWSVPELMQAIVILVHFHALSGYVFGCGVTPEIDLSCGHTFRTPSLSDSSANAEPMPRKESSAGKDKCQQQENTQALLKKLYELEKDLSQNEMTSHEETLRQFQVIEKQETEVCNTETNGIPAPLSSGFERFIVDLQFQYSDFAKRDKDTVSVLRAQEYSWEEHGFSLLNRLYPGMGNLLDQKFSTITNLTYNTMGSADKVDTSTFRNATWQYIHLVLGILHDDYHYDAVNKLFIKPYKTYIKMVTCFPQRVMRADYDKFVEDFEHSEKVHLNMLALEAKTQAELLYALRAIMRVMT